MSKVKANPNILTLPCVPFTQNGEVSYQVAVPADLLQNICKLYRYNPNLTPNHDKQGYQRPKSELRAKRFGQYMLRPGSFCPPLIVNDREGRCAYDPKTRRLTVDLKYVMSMVDGQHREGGFAWLKENGDISLYDVPLVITQRDTLLEELRMFQDCNDNVQKVATSLCNNLRLEIAGALGEEAIPDKDRAKLVVTETIRLINNRRNGPWSKKIARAGENPYTKAQIKKNPALASKKFIRDAQLTRSLLPIANYLKDHFTFENYKAQAEELSEIVETFWSVLQSKLKTATVTPHDYCLQKSLGITALHKVLLFMLQATHPEDWGKMKTYRNFISNCPFLTDEKYWANGGNDSFGRYGTSEAAAAKVAKTIIRSLRGQGGPPPIKIAK